MIQRINRRFERQLPSKKAKSIYIFAEGRTREEQYFNYFKEIDSRINIEVYKLDSEENNSPLGLLEIAKINIIGTKDNPPHYSFQKNDEVWIVIDVDKDRDDSRSPQIETIIKELKEFENWFFVQSNPCFETWLYYHQESVLPPLNEELEYCPAWKNLVNEIILGGFNSRKHSIYIGNAIQNAENNFLLDEQGKIKIGSTEVFKLGKSILPLVKDKIQKRFDEVEEEKAK
ncbi:RloB family protein [Bernardetia sp. Wsw4-3y2]|uniref:RloB family protein n=1 Tax=Bernardetia sp. Wsw4-3y2 TaxID=3127471 RepID=UPI0030CB44E4